MRKVLILGGYGNFGKRIARALCRAEVPIIIAGRSAKKAKALKAALQADYSSVANLDVQIETACFDAQKDLVAALKRLKPAVVINTCGPFQGSGYDIALNCINAGVHYIDLADGRDFVTGIKRLDESAQENGVAIISGASTVPGLSSAVLEYFKGEFSQIYHMKYGISPGQKAERGLATTQGIMTYVGRPLKGFPGPRGPAAKAYGWQDIYRQNYPKLGKRWMANCDIPDLDLLPPRYGLKTIQFSAGLELGALHLGLWALSWPVRAGLALNLSARAKSLLAISNWFDRFGSSDGGMHILLSGLGPDGRPHRREWYIIALNGDGPQIPTIPAIVLAKKLIGNELAFRGAAACVGMVTLDEYLQELAGFDVQTFDI